MLKTENVEIWGFQAAIRGMRNSWNSWEQSDSALCKGADGFEDCTISILGECPRCNDFKDDVFCIGEKDMKLMQQLVKAGSSHRKFMRQIFVSMDITAPLYWWKEFDTYKIGTTANSTSTMHTVAVKQFEQSDFSIEHLDDESKNTFNRLLWTLNRQRSAYLATKDKRAWWQLIQLLPTSYNQRRTVTITYENALNMIEQRCGHKLDEWQELVKTLENLSYMKLLHST